MSNNIENDLSIYSFNGINKCFDNKIRLNFENDYIISFPSGHCISSINIETKEYSIVYLDNNSKIVSFYSFENFNYYLIEQAVESGDEDEEAKSHFSFVSKNSNKIGLAEKIKVESGLKLIDFCVSNDSASGCLLYKSISTNLKNTYQLMSLTLSTNESKFKLDFSYKFSDKNEIIQVSFSLNNKNEILILFKNSFKIIETQRFKTKWYFKFDDPIKIVSFLVCLFSCFLN
jgi:hypothetical protein